MIVQLQEDFIQHFKLTGTNYHVHYTTLNGRCTINDPKSCDSCISKGKRQCDESSFKQILILEAKAVVFCVCIEDFLNQFTGRKADSKSKCDLMLYGGSKVSFIDLYCGEEKFVYSYETTHSDGRIEHKIGKLATVRKQIASTINKLCEVPKIEQTLQSYAVKDGLFAYRSKNNHVEDSFQVGSLENSINIFIKTAEAACSNLHTLLTHGFVFKTVLYPEAYVW